MKAISLLFIILISGIFTVTLSKTAYCILSQNISSGVSGIAMFVQFGEENPTWVIANVDGLSPGYHGFHLQESSNFTEGCGSTGLHFNPFNETHGGPFSEHRHVGDLGNILADITGNGRLNYHDPVVTLYGEYSIIGKTCLIHETYDDLGEGHDEHSLLNGNAMGRPNCGIIVEGVPNTS